MQNFNIDFIGNLVGLFTILIGLLTAIIKLLTAYKKSKQEQIGTSKFSFKSMRTSIWFIIGFLLMILGLIILIFFNFIIDQPLSDDFIYIKGGKFNWAGRMINVNDFYILSHEVTTSEYLRFVSENNNDARYYPQWKNPSLKEDKIIYEYYHGFTSDNQPIVGITWEQANSYCIWLSKKIGKKMNLPTEIQWEYAARGGGAGSFGIGLFGQEITQENFSNYAWFRDNQNQGVFKRSTKPIKQKSPNVFGIYDMWGNAAEWILDDFKNGGKIIKGGSWEDPIDFCETSFCDGLNWNIQKRTITFRVVCEP